MHKKLVDVTLDGFAASASKAGQQLSVTVSDLVTSESPYFFLYAEQITNMILPKIGDLTLRDKLNRYLLVIHPDNTADFYMNDFPTTNKVKINRSVKAGDPIFLNDIEDVSEVGFPGIQINSDDRVVFIDRAGWRFGIYFNFKRQLDTHALGSELAGLRKRLLFENVLEKALAQVRAPTSAAAFIITEGKTDWRHIKKAFDKIGCTTTFQFSDADEDIGDMVLLDICRRARSYPPNATPVICIFDRDNPDIINELPRQLGNSEAEYQKWGNNVFSVVIPHPPDKSQYKNISIEMYYPDEVLKRLTADRKRLFFDNELRIEIMPGERPRKIPIPAKHEREFTKKLVSKDVENIVDSSNRQVAISKTAFAEMIYNEKPPFDTNIDFKNFRVLLESLEKIIFTARTSEKST